MFTAIDLLRKNATKYRTPKTLNVVFILNNLLTEK